MADNEDSVRYLQISGWRYAGSMLVGGKFVSYWTPPYTPDLGSMKLEDVNKWLLPFEQALERCRAEHSAKNAEHGANVPHVTGSAEPES